MPAVLASARTTLLGLAVIVALMVWALPGLAILVGYAVLVAYALSPVVSALEQVRGPGGRRLPRHIAAASVILLLVALVGWLLALAIPHLASELLHLASVTPATLGRLAEAIRQYGAVNGLSSWLDPLVESARTSASNRLGNLGSVLPAVVGRIFGSLADLLGLALLPLLAFYLLADSEAVQASALRFVPAESRPDLARMSGAVDRALRGWVRGQAIVCLVMGGTVGIALTLLHYPSALLLGVMTGVAELIPYLGFLIAVVAVALVGLSVDPRTAMLGVAAYVSLNWLTGSFVTPRVMGRFLKMHPFVVTVSVLAGAELLGPAGAVLALPGAAVLQSLIDQFAGRIPAKARVGGGSQGVGPGA